MSVLSSPGYSATVFMSFFSLLCVLAIEQFKALPAARVLAGQGAFAEFIEMHCNGGQYRHGVIAWGLGAALPAVLVGALGLAADAAHSLAGFAFAVLVLYFTVGFRQFSHFFTDIQLALRLDELDRALQVLADWQGRSAMRYVTGDVVRIAIERGVVAAYRHVFAPIFWFVLIGPAGAVLYRFSLVAAERWRAEGGEYAEAGRFGEFSGLVVEVLDWLPVRISALTFAIVGDFEDAIYCWRTQATQWPESASGILLSSAAGALGVRLGSPLPDDLGIEPRPELGLGDDADIEHMQSATGLIWRAQVLSLLLLGLLTLSAWVGS